MCRCARPTTSGRGSRSSRASWRVSGRCGGSTRRICTGSPRWPAARPSGMPRSSSRARPAHRLALHRRTCATTATWRFEPIGGRRDPHARGDRARARGVAEHAAELLGLAQRRVRRDMERFKDLVESLPATGEAGDAGGGRDRASGDSDATLGPEGYSETTRLPSLSRLRGMTVVNREDEEGRQGAARSISTRAPTTSAIWASRPDGCRAAPTSCPSTT
jgi:hypothetical protein